ncbi:unnamed protein product, partial [Mesorhabditis spiculigera]
MFDIFTASARTPTYISFVQPQPDGVSLRSCLPYAENYAYYKMPNIDCGIANVEEELTAMAQLLDKNEDNFDALSEHSSMHSVITTKTSSSRLNSSLTKLRNTIQKRCSFNQGNASKFPTFSRRQQFKLHPFDVASPEKENYRPLEALKQSQEVSSPRVLVVKRHSMCEKSFRKRVLQRRETELEERDRRKYQNRMLLKERLVDYVELRGQSIDLPSYAELMPTPIEMPDPETPKAVQIQRVPADEFSTPKAATPVQGYYRKRTAVRRHVSDATSFLKGPVIPGSIFEDDVRLRTPRVHRFNQRLL